MNRSTGIFGNAATALLASTAAVLFLCHAAHSQSTKWKPEKGIEFVVAGGAGGGIDLIARTAQTIFLEKKLVETPLTIVNRPGAGNALGYAYVNQHPADAHFLSITGPNIVTNRITGSNPIDFNDMTPIVMLSSESVAVTVKIDSPIKNGKDLINRLVKDPASVSFGVAPNIGGSNHLAAVALLKAAGIDSRKIKFVVFPDSARSGIAVMGGHVDVNVSSSAQVAGGKLRILGVTSSQRLPGSLAAAPTWKEQGVDIDYGSWRAVIGARGLQPAQVAYWEHLFGQLVQTNEWKDALEKRVWVNIYRNSEQTRRFLDSERTSFASMLRELDLAKGN